MSLLDSTGGTTRELSRRTPMLRYGVAIGAVAVAWLARVALTPSLGPTELPFLTFFPAIAWATWYGGLGPGLLALALSTFTADWFFVDPLRSFQVARPVALFGFTISAGFILAAIEAMHRARRQLATSGDTLATTLRSIGDGVIVTDSSGTVNFLNPEAERLTGWSVDDARGKPLADVFHIVNETTRAVVSNPVEKVLRDGTVVGLANHTVLIARDGSETPIDDSAAPIREPGQPVVGVVLVFRDVRAERVAQEVRARLASIVESSGDAIISKTADGIVRTWNASAEKLLGYSAPEIIGRPIATIIPPELLEEESGILARLRSGRPTELVETTRMTKDGRRIPVSVQISLLRNSDGEVVGASKIIRDLSELTHARDALIRERDLLTKTLTSIGDAVIITNGAGEVTFVNPVAEQLTGWTHSDATGRQLEEVFRIVQEDTRTTVENPAYRAMREGAIMGLSNHTLLISRNGAERVIDDTAAPIRDSQGRVVGSVLVFRDVTAKRHAAREADRRKNEFLATLAHELRNPLAPIRNSIALLQLKGPPDPTLVEARDIIDRQVRLMTRLLDDLLEVSRLDQQKLILRKEPVSLRSVITSAIEAANPGIESRHHRISVEMPADVVVDGDPLRLAQVFGNLLNNAAKYTDDGGEIRVVGAREHGWVVVTVSDTGIGIAPESLPRLFEMFSQVPLSLERAQGGIGVGLALSKGLVTLHGGTLTAESDGPGKGSVFTVKLPAFDGVIEPAPELKDQLHRRGGTSLRVLIADDVHDNADTLALLLRALDHTVEVAYDGQEAVELAERFRPDVGLFDVAMPVMTGLEACRVIRSQPWGQSIYMIAQTGWGQEDDQKRVRDAGFDRHLLKPVDSATLMAVLASMPNQKQ